MFQMKIPANVAQGRAVYSSPRQTASNQDRNKNVEKHIIWFHIYFRVCRRKGPNVSFPVLANDDIRLWYVGKDSYVGVFTCEVVYYETMKKIVILLHLGHLQSILKL